MSDLHREGNRSGTSERIDNLIFWGLWLILFGTPLALSRFNVSVYGLTKATFLRTLTLIILAGWVVKAISSRKIRLVRTPLDAAVIAFTAVALLSTFFSAYSAVSLWGRYREHQGLLAVINYVLVFFLVTNFIKKKSDFRKIFFALLASATLVSLYAIFQHFGIDFLSYQGVPYQEMRSWSTLGNPIFLGGYLALVIPLVFATVLLGEFGVTGRLLLIGILILLVVALVFTLTRAAWLGAILGVIFVLALSLPELKKHKASLLWMTIMIVILSSAVLLIGRSEVGSSVAQRFLSIFSLHWEGGRIKLWLDLLPLLLRRPLLGSGPDTFYIVSPLGGSGGTHNEYLNIAITLGSLGLGAFLFVLISLAFSSWKYLRSEDTKGNWLIIGILGGLAAYLVHLTFSFSSIGSALSFWFLLGVAGARLRQPGREVEISLSSSTVRFLFGSILAAIIVLAAAASAKTFAADVYFARAGIYEKEGMLERSIGANISAARLNPSEEVYLTGLGQRYLSLSERESWQREAHLGRAQQFFRKSLALNPNSVEARLGLGAALASGGEIEGALGQWRAVLAFDPGQYDAYWYIGQTYESLGLFAEAREAYLSVLRINPQDADARVALDRLEGRE